MGRGVCWGGGDDEVANGQKEVHEGGQRRWTRRQGSARKGKGRAMHRSK